MKIKEFFESKEKIAINAHTEEEAIKLCNAFGKAGYEWNNGISYLRTTYWKDECMETCYTNSSTYGDKHFYEDNNYKILSMDDIEFEETITVADYIDRNKIIEGWNSGMHTCQKCYKLKYESSCSNLYCKECEFSKAVNIANYLKSTYTPKQEITLTEFEKQIILNLDDKWKWITRSISGNIYIFEQKPFKNIGIWVSDKEFILFSEAFKDEIFKFITFENKEPTSIEKLKEIANNE